MSTLGVEVREGCAETAPELSSLEAVEVRMTLMERRNVSRPQRTGSEVGNERRSRASSSETKGAWVKSGQSWADLAEEENP